MSARVRRNPKPLTLGDVNGFAFEEEFTGVLEDHDPGALDGDGDNDRNPEPPSDGEPPLTSPTLTVRVADKALSLTWPPVANDDPVTYKIYKSTTNGFTPDDATNLHAQTDATSFIVDGLTNGQLYYLQAIAMDADGEAPVGPQASGTPSPTYGGGTPPPTPNTPVVTGGIGSLHVRWTGVSHLDILKYEVHLSTTNGFTPSASTKCGDLVGEMMTIWTLPPQGNTTRLTIGTTYYIKIVGVSGAYTSVSAQASGTPIQANTAELAVGSVKADQIFANAVQAGHLAADLILVTRLIAGSAANARLEFGSLGGSFVGMRAYKDSVNKTLDIDGGTGNVDLNGIIIKIGSGAGASTMKARHSSSTIQHTLNAGEILLDELGMRFYLPNNNTAVIDLSFLGGGTITGAAFVTSGSGDNVNIPAVGDRIAFRNGLTRYGFIKQTGTGSFDIAADGGAVLKLMSSDNSVYFRILNSHIEANGRIEPNADQTRNLGASAKAWNTVFAQTFNDVSDQSEKDNIRACPLGLEYVLSLTPRRWEWISGGKTADGFVAQEVDAAGGIVTFEDGRGLLSYNHLLAPIVSAIQTIAARVEALEAA